MASELIINLPSITYVKDPFNENLAPLSTAPTPGVLAVTVNGKQVVHGGVSLSTSDLNLNKGNVGTIGYCLFKNKDNTNNIQVGSDGTLYPLLLKPGEIAVVRWNAAAIHAKSAAGTPIFEYWVVED